MTTDEAAFQAQLDDAPDCHVGRACLADWLDEQGDPRAEPIRWLAQRGIFPCRRVAEYGSADTVLVDDELQVVARPPRVEWSWSRQSGPTRSPHDLPAALWYDKDKPIRIYSLPIRNFYELRRYLCDPFPSRRAAEAAFCQAYFEAKDQGWVPNFSAKAYWTPEDDEKETVEVVTHFLHGGRLHRVQP